MNKNYSLGLYEKAMPTGLDFAKMLESTRECGFDRLEISIDETNDRLARLDWPSEKRSELRRLCAETGVPIRTMCLSGHRKYPLGSRDPETRRTSLEIMKKALEFSCEVGIGIIQLAGYDVYYEEGGADTEKYFFEGLQKSVELAAQAGVLLGFETMETPFMDTVEKAMKYVTLINSPYLGVYPDIGNLKNASLIYGNDLTADLSLGAGHVMAGHLKETVSGVYRNRSFGDGHTEYIPCIAELWRQGVRMFTGEFWYLGEENYRDTLCRSSAFLRDKIESAITSVSVRNT